jgi:cobalt-zinc-cadmium efflux system outer membrane protein
VQGLRVTLALAALAAGATLGGCRQTAARVELSDASPVSPAYDQRARAVHAQSEHLAGVNELAQASLAPANADAPVIEPDEPRGFGAQGTGRLVTGGTRSRGAAARRSAELVLPIAFDQEQAAEPEAAPLLDVPPELPGAQTPQIRLPPFNPDEPIDERRTALRSVYATLPALPAEQVVDSTTEGKLSLDDLQRTAYSRSPVIAVAWSAVDAARGRAVQAGLCPNPVVGYEGDSINTMDTAGYNGVYFEQTYVTAGKLGLAQQAALMEVRAAEYAYRRSRVEVAAAVRRAYFGVLVAQERVRLARAMAALTEKAYDAQIDLVAGGQSAAHEPLQLKVLALKSRNDVVTAENAYIGSWRELAAVLNSPEMAPVALAGSVESATPELQFEAAKRALLARHTDLSIAQAQISQQNYNLELQRVTPIPNLELYTAIQHDDTNSRNNIAYNVQIGLPLPVFNRNQGNISAANAELIRAQHNWVSTRNELTAQLAEAYARYATARELAATYRSDIVPSQVQTYRGIYTQFRAVGGNSDFAEVIVSQQTLAQVLGEYLNTLAGEWDSAVDVAELLQVDDMYTMDGIAMPPRLEPAPAE